MSIRTRQTNTAHPAPAGLGPRRWLAVAAALLTLLVAGGVLASRSGIPLEEMAALGYPGVFLVMFVSGCSIIFPVPGQAAVLAAGAVWNPVLVGISAGLGNATGELTGYLAGRAGATVLGGRSAPRWWSLLGRWLSRYGFFAIMGIAAIPNPVFDAIGLLAGSLAYPARRFWLACALGNSVKYTAMAFLGDTVTAWWLTLG